MLEPVFQPNARQRHRRRARQHRHGEQAGADDAEAEQQEGEVAGDRPQRLGRLRRGLDVGHAVACSVAAVVSMMKKATRFDMPMPTSVPADAAQLRGRLFGLLEQGRGLGIGLLLLDFLRRSARRTGRG